MNTSFPTSTSDDDTLPERANQPGLGGGASPAPVDASSPSNEMLDRVVQSAHEAIDRLADTAAPHVQRLQQGMATASEALQGRAEQARDTGDEWAEALRTTVRDNPLAAVAAALVAGVIIARLVQR